PRPPRRRGRDRDVCPAPQPPPTGHRHASMSQPLRVAGIAGTQQHRDRPGSCAWAQPPDPAGSWPRESEYLLGAAATLRASGEPTPGTIATSRPPREPSPPRDATPLLISTIAVDGKRFSLDYGTFIRVRRRRLRAPATSRTPPGSPAPPGPAWPPASGGRCPGPGASPAGGSTTPADAPRPARSPGRTPPP